RHREHDAGLARECEAAARCRSSRGDGGIDARSSRVVRDGVLRTRRYQRRRAVGRWPRSALEPARRRRDTRAHAAGSATAGTQRAAEPHHHEPAVQLRRGHTLVEALCALVLGGLLAAASGLALTSARRALEMAEERDVGGRAEREAVA